MPAGFHTYCKWGSLSVPKECATILARFRRQSPTTFIVVRRRYGACMQENHKLVIQRWGSGAFFEFSPLSS